MEIDPLDFESLEQELSRDIFADHTGKRGLATQAGKRHQCGRDRPSSRLVGSEALIFFVAFGKAIESHTDIPHRDSDADRVPICHGCATLQDVSSNRDRRPRSQARDGGSSPDQTSAIKGRGAVSNHASRFEPNDYEIFDDGWGTIEEERTKPATEVIPERTRTILAKNDSPDVPFSQSINPYKGCEHGCIYCFARPTHAFLGMSPGLDFETRIVSKPDAARVLRRQLASAKYKCDVIALGANTDPYQPVERGLGITRSILEELSGCNHPVGVVTKSELVLRDLDLLAPMARKGLAHVFVSMTSLDPALSRVMEPRAASPSRRLETIRRLCEAGVPVGVLASPMIPRLNDAELEQILESSSAVGATAAGTILLRLPLEIKDLFREWLEEHFPAKARHVLALVRDTRGGSLYNSDYGTRMRGEGPYADLLQQRFAVACKKLGLAGRIVPLDRTQFRPPVLSGQQMGLFE